MKKSQTLIASTALIALVLAAVYLWYRSSNEALQNTSFNPQATARENFFSADDLKRDLKDYGQLTRLPASTPDEALLKKMKQLFLDGNQYELDKFIKAYMLDKAISRGEKINTLLGLLKLLEADNHKMYALDILAALHPIEFSSQLIDFYNQPNQTSAIRERALMTLGQAFLFAPSSPPSPDEAVLLNSNISKIQNFMREQVGSQDPTIQRAALAEYVRTLPQSEVAQNLNTLLNQSSLSYEDKTQLKINTALSEPSSSQSLILNEVLAEAKAKPENDETVRQKVIGLLTGTGLDGVLTQDSKYLLQGYLQSKEPKLLIPSDSMTTYSEYNEWLTAWAATHTTGTLSTAQWTADYLKQLDDPLKLAIGVALANDAVLTNLDRSNALRNIGAKIKAGQATATANQGQIFDAAMVRIGQISQAN